MEKNGFDLPKPCDDYTSKEEFDEDLFENIDKIEQYEKNNAKSNSASQTQIEISKTLLECSQILIEAREYAKSTDTLHAMNENFILEKLRVFKQDLQTCLNKYKTHFDLSFNYERACKLYYDSNGNLLDSVKEYLPFPPVEYISLPPEDIEDDEK